MTAQAELIPGVKPYYDEDGMTLYHGDCRDLLQLVAARSIGAVVTDPPYGVRKADWDNAFPVSWWGDAARIADVIGLMPGVWNIPLCPPHIGRLKYRWTLSAHLVNGMTRGAIGFGNWIPLLLYAADGAKLHRKETDCRQFSIGSETRPAHPSPKPLCVMRWFIKRVPGELILDPYTGSGTTLLAAKENGRRAIGIEIEERYCEIAARRLAQGVFQFEEKT